MTRYWAAAAWNGSEEIRDVEIDVAGGRIDRVQIGVPPSGRAIRLPGALIPGLVNAHSHAFHRAMRGRTGGDDFWSWREEMYRIAGLLDPDSYRRLAAAVFTEMALAGITAVGEFHYLHHQPGGRTYSDPNDMGHAVIEAARSVGLRITLLDTCYLTADVDGSPVRGTQTRFSDRSEERWAERHRQLADRYADAEDVVIGAAIHSVRAVPETAMATVAAAVDGPLHIHVSEQEAENTACLRRHGRSPTRVLWDAGVLGPATTVVHGVHTDDADREVLAQSGAGLCVCPSTEAGLGDGFAPTAEIAGRGIPISIGSDAHAVIDLFVEMRSVEHNDRSRHGRREVHDPAALFSMATANGASALGMAPWGLTAGAPADFVAVDDASVRTVGTDGVAGLAMTASASDVTDVVAGGRRIVAHGEHVETPDAAAALKAAISVLWSRTP